MNSILLHCITSTLTRYVDSTPSTYAVRLCAKDLRHSTPRARTGCELKLRCSCAIFITIVTILELLYYYYYYRFDIVTSLSSVAVRQFFDATHTDLGLDARPTHSSRHNNIQRDSLFTVSSLIFRTRFLKGTNVSLHSFNKYFLSR